MGTPCRTFLSLLTATLLSASLLPIGAAHPADLSGKLPEHWEEGIEGNGHMLWHEVYQTLHNQHNTHCCNDQHCRPTTAKFANGVWYAKVNGVWAVMQKYQYVQEYRYSWSETPHVCASGNNIYCFVPPPAQG